MSSMIRSIYYSSVWIEIEYSSRFLPPVNPNPQSIASISFVARGLESEYNRVQISSTSVHNIIWSFLWESGVVAYINDHNRFFLLPASRPRPRPPATASRPWLCRPRPAGHSKPATAIRGRISNSRRSKGRRRRNRTKRIVAAAATEEKKHQQSHKQKM